MVTRPPQYTPQTPSVKVRLRRICSLKSLQRLKLLLTLGGNLQNLGPASLFVYWEFNVIFYTLGYIHDRKGVMLLILQD